MCLSNFLTLARKRDKRFSANHNAKSIDKTFRLAGHLHFVKLFFLRIFRREVAKILSYSSLEGTILEACPRPGSVRSQLSGSASASDLPLT